MATTSFALLRFLFVKPEKDDRNVSMYILSLFILGSTRS